MLIIGLCWIVCTQQLVWAQLSPVSYEELPPLPFRAALLEEMVTKDSIVYTTAEEGFSFQTAVGKKGFSIYPSQGREACAKVYALAMPYTKKTIDHLPCFPNLHYLHLQVSHFMKEEEVATVIKTIAQTTSITHLSISAQNRGIPYTLPTTIEKNKKIKCKKGKKTLTHVYLNYNLETLPSVLYNNPLVDLAICSDSFRVLSKQVRKLKKLKKLHISGRENSHLGSSTNSPFARHNAQRDLYKAFDQLPINYPDYYQLAPIKQLPEQCQQLKSLEKLVLYSKEMDSFPIVGTGFSPKELLLAIPKLKILPISFGNSSPLELLFLYQMDSLKKVTQYQHFPLSLALCDTPLEPILEQSTQLKMEGTRLTIKLSNLFDWLKVKGKDRLVELPLLRVFGHQQKGSRMAQWLFIQQQLPYAKLVSSLHPEPAVKLAHAPYLFVNQHHPPIAIHREKLAKNYPKEYLHIKPFAFYTANNRVFYAVDKAGTPPQAREEWLVFHPFLPLQQPQSTTKNESTLWKYHHYSSPIALAGRTPNGEMSLQQASYARAIDLLTLTQKGKETAASLLTSLRRYANLEKLYLHYDSLTPLLKDSLRSILPDLASLNHLVVYSRDNRIIEEFPLLPSIWTLELRVSGLSLDGQELLKTFPNLRHLKVDTLVTTDNYQAICALPYLQTFRWSHLKEKMGKKKQNPLEKVNCHFLAGREEKIQLINDIGEPVNVVHTLQPLPITAPIDTVFYYMNPADKLSIQLLEVSPKQLSILDALPQVQGLIIVDQEEQASPIIPLSFIEKISAKSYVQFSQTTVENNPGLKTWINNTTYLSVNSQWDNKYILIKNSEKNLLNKGVLVKEELEQGVYFLTK